MARIRSIKPDFWTSEQVMECSPIARLMFIGMWNFADDTGRLPHSAKAIKAKIFPSDDISLDSVRGMLRELSANGLILVYAVEDEEFLQITGWQHQRIDKPQPSKYPAPFFDDSGKVLGTIPPDRKGEDRKGEEKNSRAASPSKETEFEELKRLYPKRAGNYGWKAAERKFNSLVKTGVAPEAIIAAAIRLGVTLKSKIGTEFIPMPASWLNSEDFLEAAVAAFEPEKPIDWDAICITYKKLGIWSKHAPGNSPDSSSCQCPPEILAKHGIASSSSHDPPPGPMLRTMQ